jgi:hypothetical protein
MNTQFWYFLLTGKRDEQTGMFANFYTYGQDFGEALERTKLVAQETQSIIDSEAIEACRLDNLQEFKIPEDTVEIDKGVYMKAALHTYPLTDTEQSFIPPTGIIKSTDDDEFDYELITEAFVAFNKDENGIFEFELVAGKSKLIDTFIEAINFLPSVDGFWIYIWNHWDDSKTELWAGKNIADKKSAVDFLLRHKSDTLENGFLDCVVHCKIGETNLTLDDHKKIQLHTKDQNLFDDFGEKISDLGFKQTKEFYNLEFNYHHYHYKPANSLSRDDFKGLLRNNNFEKIDEWD